MRNMKMIKIDNVITYHVNIKRVHVTDPPTFKRA